MPFYTDAYLADTHHLSAEAHGALLLLLLHTWRHNGTPPRDDDTLLAQVARVSPRRWKSLRPSLQPLFDTSHGVWRQKRLEKTWAEVSAKIEANRAKGQLGNQVKKARAEQRSGAQAASADAQPGATQPRTPPTTHEPMLHEPVNPNPASMLQPPPAPKPPSTPALDGLARFLDNSFLLVGMGDESVLSPALLPQIEEAEREADALLAPADLAVRRAWVHKLFTHFEPNPSPTRAERMADYEAELGRLPADLLPRAVRHGLVSHRFPNVPKLADLLPAVSAELQRREARKANLARLKRRVPASP